MADEWILKHYDGGAVSTTLDGGISGATTSIVVTDGSGLPDGSSGPFVLVLDRGNAGEEKILVDTRSGNTLTVQQRGYDGTAAAAHLDDVTVAACIDAHSIQQANALAAVMDSTGSMAYRGSGFSYVELPVPGNGYWMVTAGGVPVCVTAAAAATAMLANAAGDGLAVTAGVLEVNVDGGTIDIVADVLGVAAGGISANELATGAVTSAKIQDGTIATGDIADGAITTGKIANGTILEGDIADGAITSAKILDSTIATGDLADGAVTSAKIQDGTIANGDLSAAMVASNIKQILRDSYCGRAIRATSVEIPNNTVTVLVADSEDYDYSTMHNTTTGHITCPAAGVIAVSANVTYEVVNATGYRTVEIRRYNSGGTLQNVVAADSRSAGDNAADYTQISCHGEIDVAANDIIRIEVVHTAGVGIDVVAGVGIESGYSWHYVRLT